MERRVVTVCGIVQGVGVRPFVYGLATRFHLRGSVRNQSGSVRIEVEGEAGALDRFLDELVGRPPPLAQIDHVAWEPRAVQGDALFRIETSEPDASSVFVSPDIATCDACLAELFDPADRRWRYPFLNCTHCGPRLTIITGAPYDRPNTTMAAFAMCSDCLAEYQDPTDRRFHAQPTACPRCGPQLQVFDGSGEPVVTEDPVGWLCAALRQGQIAALKGLGGYHLACDARNGHAVALLRRRKHRDEKPLAVMVRDVQAARQLCELSSQECQLLESSRRPIVLLRRRATVGMAEGIAPGSPDLGVMLPYTPLHYLLLRDWGESPLVMTSGNRSDEPICYQDGEAHRRLQGIADLFLVHDRPIRVRCDDSVTRVVDGVELPLRRSRGYAPEPIRLPFGCRRPILAVGGQLKSTFALGREEHALLSQHLGDLDDFQAYRAFEQDVALYEQLFAVRPEVIVCDLHPDYAASRYAAERAGRQRVTLRHVQHHHAHLAACMAEHGLDEPVIGVCFDGTGYGTDGAVWGGEFLVGDYSRFRRVAHLRYVGMPGGERAIREPWRMAVSQLADAEATCETLQRRLPSSQWRMVETMLDRGLNTPITSSVGRLFDAVAALAGVRDRVSYEGQAAVQLEWLAREAVADRMYPFEISEEVASEQGGVPMLVVDTRPMILGVAADVTEGSEARPIARRFHSTLVEMIGVVCARIRAATALEAVALSGGVFANALLTHEVVARLQREQFRIYRHRRVPPNDGGLSLGQVAVAAAWDMQGDDGGDMAEAMRRYPSPALTGDQSLHEPRRWTNASGGDGRAES